MPNTILLHRVLKASPAKVYRAFTDANAIASWIPPYGFVGEIHNMDTKPGGSFRMSFINFTTGSRHSFGCKYIELRPGELIKYTNTFDDPDLPGEMTVTITLKSVSCGTDLKIVQEHVPDQIPEELCYLGWQESLDKLKKLVESEIPDVV